ncbi:AP-1 complex subunit beta-1 [Varanus komodoensis]|nr:AP-1 complex subunit beta-1 [Varanus komodoensis]
MGGFLPPPSLMEPWIARRLKFAFPPTNCVCANRHSPAYHLKHAVSSKLQGSNIFTIAKRNVEGQDMLYQSLKLTNGIWVLAELRIQPGNPNLTLSLKCRAPEVAQHVFQAYETILKN